jgi:hypothetical protein
MTPPDDTAAVSPTNEESGGRRPGLLAKIGLSVGSLFVLAIAAELLMQIFVPLLYRPRFTKVDPEVGWTHSPNVSAEQEMEGHQYVVTYNEHGYRWPEHSLEKPDGVYRVVVLGDSFVDGSEVGDQETFTWLLQESLDGVEVINMGVYGYNTGQELVTLETRGLDFDPDLVVLVSIQNDLYYNNSNFDFFGPAPRFVMEGDSLRFEGTDHPLARESFRATTLPFPGRAVLHRHSYLYYLANQLIFQRVRGPAIVDRINEQIHALDADERDELYRRIVLRMRDRVEDYGAEFLVVFGHEPGVLQMDPWHAGVEAMLDEAGVATLDLFDPLREWEESDEESLYYVNNFHWNVRGHRFVAELLAPRLEAYRDGTAPEAEAESAMDEGRTAAGEVGSPEG